jgi:hypothetical protein
MSYIDISGSWVFLYSGIKNTKETNPNRDSFFVRQAISVHAISGLQLDYNKLTIKLQVKGFTNEVQCSCRTKDVFYQSTSKLLFALESVGLDKRYMIPTD